MDSLILSLVAAIGSSGFIVAFLLYTFVNNPEKIEKWAAILNKILAGLGGLFKSAHRNYVKYDLQGRVNSFTKAVSVNAPYLEETRIEIEWVDTTVDPKTFLKNGKAVLRLRREDPDELNFVHGAYFSVATKLLPTVKRYISPSQCQSIDLFVTSELMTKEKFAVKEYFLDRYLHPKVGSDGKIAEYFSKYDIINKYGAFYPILLQELYFLSVKVYMSLKNDRIISEVNRLIDFLQNVASRGVGEEIELNFVGDYCKFGIVIVGTGDKMSLEGTEPYVKYIESILKRKAVETVYVLGKNDYKDFMQEVCRDLYADFEIFRRHDYDGVIHLSNGSETITKKQHLIVMRSIEASIYQSASK